MRAHFNGHRGARGRQGLPVRGLVIRARRGTVLYLGGESPRGVAAALLGAGRNIGRFRLGIGLDEDIVEKELLERGGGAGSLQVDVGAVEGEVIGGAVDLGAVQEHGEGGGVHQEVHAVEALAYRARGQRGFRAVVAAFQGIGRPPRGMFYGKAEPVVLVVRVGIDRLAQGDAGPGIAGAGPRVEFDAVVPAGREGILAGAAQPVVARVERAAEEEVQAVELDIAHRARLRGGRLDVRPGGGAGQGAVPGVEVVPQREGVGYAGGRRGRSAAGIEIDSARAGGDRGELDPDLRGVGVDAGLYVVGQGGGAAGDRRRGEAYIGAVGVHPAGGYRGLRIERQQHRVVGQRRGIRGIEGERLPVFPGRVEPLIGARGGKAGGAPVMVQAQAYVGAGAGDVGGVVRARRELRLGAFRISYQGSGFIGQAKE